MSKPKMKFFTSKTCSPCNSLKVHLDEFEKLADVEMIDVEEEPNKAEELGVMSVPTIIIYTDEQDDELVRYIGSTSPKVIKEALEMAY